MVQWSRHCTSTEGAWIQSWSALVSTPGAAKKEKPNKKWTLLCKKWLSVNTNAFGPWDSVSHLAQGRIFVCVRNHLLCAGEQILNIVTTPVLMYQMVENNMDKARDLDFSPNSATNCSLGRVLPTLPVLSLRNGNNNPDLEGCLRAQCKWPSPEPALGAGSRSRGPDLLPSVRPSRRRPGGPGARALAGGGRGRTARQGFVQRGLVARLQGRDDDARRASGRLGWAARLRAASWCCSTRTRRCATACWPT